MLPEIKKNNRESILKKKKLYKFMIPILWRNGKRLKFIDYRINKEGVIKNRHGLKLKFRKDHKGYVIVNLQLSGRTYYSVRIHRLLYETFIEKIKNQINHIDGKKDNFSLNNLEDVTQSENMQHAKRTGLNWTKEWVQTMRRKNSGEKCVLYGKGGETHHAAKVSDLDVVKIRRLNYIKNYSVSRLSEIFGVSKGCIQHILMGHTHNPERLTRGGLKERYSHGIA
jgi:hypothetical protein